MRTNEFSPVLNWEKAKKELTAFEMGIIEDLINCGGLHGKGLSDKVKNRKQYKNLERMHIVYVINRCGSLSVYFTDQFIEK